VTSRSPAVIVPAVYDVRVCREGRPHPDHEESELTEARTSLTHPRTGALLEPVGFRANGDPIWPILGAAEDDDADEGGDDEGEDDDSDDEEEDDDSDDEDGDDDSDDGKGKPKPKKPEDEIRELKAALRKANRDARRNRIRAKGGNPDKDGDGDDDGPDVNERATAMAKPIVIRAEARTLLADAGFTGDAKAATRLIRTLDLRGVDVELDDDGEVVDIDGLDEQIEELVEDWPQLFGKGASGTTRRRSAGRIDATRDSGSGRGRSGSGGKGKSATERQAEQLMGTVRPRR